MRVQILSGRLTTSGVRLETVLATSSFHTLSTEGPFGIREIYTPVNMIGTLGIFAAVPALAVFFHVFDEFHLQVLRFGLAVWVLTIDEFQ